MKSFNLIVTLLVPSDRTEVIQRTVDLLVVVFLVCFFLSSCSLLLGNKVKFDRFIDHFYQSCLALCPYSPPVT